MSPAVLLLGLLPMLGKCGYQPVPRTAQIGKEQFMALAREKGDIEDGMSAAMQSNPLQFSTLTDFWCAWELSDRPRKPALLIDDMQIEYEPYVRGIVPQTKLLLEAFRKAGLPVFWSSWWRFGPDDGVFNTMDRFYGPIGYKTAGNALYLHSPNGGEILEEIGPTTEEERRRVMRKSYSLSMLDERPMKWLVPDGQGTLHEELQKLGVDTVVQLGAWTDDCILATAFQAFSLQYDVVVVEDGVSTASKQHFHAIEVMRGAVAKVLLADQVADYIKKGLPVVERQDVGQGKAKGGRSELFLGHASAAMSEPAKYAGPEPAVSLSKFELLVLVQVFAITGPCCFALGWLLRGKQQSGMRETLMFG